MARVTHREKTQARVCGRNGPSELFEGAGSTPLKSIVESWSPELVVSSGCCSRSEGIEEGAGADRVAVGDVTRRNLQKSVGVLGLVAAVVHVDVRLSFSRYLAISRAFWERSPRPMDALRRTIWRGDVPEKARFLGLYT